MLLTKNIEWRWWLEQDKAFRDSKELLMSLWVLVHFNPKLPLLLACAASTYGTMLALRMPDGSEQLIGYTSHTLNSAKRNCSQIEKEGLSCIFGVKRFYSYMLGHPFTLITDHKLCWVSLMHGSQCHLKPLQEFVDGRCTCVCLSTLETLRLMLSWCLELSSLLGESAAAQTPPEFLLLTDHLANSPVTAEQIRGYTLKDPQLAPVVQFVHQGWPSSCSAYPIFQREDGTLNLWRMLTMGI